MSGFDKYAGDEAVPHEAAYDAHMTGVIFARIAKYLEIGIYLEEVKTKVVPAPKQQLKLCSIYSRKSSLRLSSQESGREKMQRRRGTR